MRLHDLYDEIFFDEIPENISRHSTVFISSLMAFENCSIPKKWPYFVSSERIFDELQCYLKERKVALEGCMKRIIVLTPYKPAKIIITAKKSIKVLMCTSKGIDYNVMYLINQNDKVTHFYAGGFTDINAALINNCFADWVRSGVERLYLNLERALEDVDNYIHLEDALNEVKKLFQSRQRKDAKVLLIVPKFGYEGFVAAVIKRLPSRVHLLEACGGVYTNLEQLLPVQKDETKALMLVTTEAIDMKEIKSKFKENGSIAIRIKSGSVTHEFNDIGYYEVRYSQLPTKIDLNLMTIMVSPETVYPIVTDSSLDPPKVPEYLRSLSKCSSVKKEANKTKTNEKQLNDKLKDKQQEKQQNSAKTCPKEKQKTNDNKETEKIAGEKQQDEDKLKNKQKKKQRISAKTCQKEKEKTYENEEAKTTAEEYPSNSKSSSPLFVRRKFAVCYTSDSDSS